ncbi:MAG: CHAT domain-containing protein [Caldilineaceae bacterium]
MSDYGTDIFHVAIEPTDRGDVTRVLASPMGRGEAPFVSPLNAADLHVFWQTMLAWTEDAGGAWDAARAVGARLFAALFPTPLDEMLYAGYRDTFQHQKPLALHLSLGEADRFLTLPWEYLFDPVRREFPALSVHSPFARYANLMQRIRPLPVDGPIRALVVVADPTGYPAIDGRRAWLNVVDTLDYLAADGRLFLEQLQKPTLHDLRRRLRSGDFHIVHFIGHILYDDQAQDGRLIFEDEMARGRPVSGEHLGQILRDSYDTRLVILESADTVFDTFNPAGLAAARLIQRGVPATVAAGGPGRRLDPGLSPRTLRCDRQLRTDWSGRGSYPGGHGGRAQRPIWGVPWLLSRTPDGFCLTTDGCRRAPRTCRPTAIVPACWNGSCA